MVYLRVGVLGDFLKSEIEAKTLIVRVSDVGLWLKVGFMVIF